MSSKSPYSPPSSSLGALGRNQCGGDGCASGNWWQPQRLLPWSCLQQRAGGLLLILPPGPGVAHRLQRIGFEGGGYRGTLADILLWILGEYAMLRGCGVLRRHLPLRPWPHEPMMPEWGECSRMAVPPRPLPPFLGWKWGIEGGGNRPPSCGPSRSRGFGHPTKAADRPRCCSQAAAHPPRSWRAHSPAGWRRRHPKSHCCRDPSKDPSAARA
jgi:hypothetical protein